MNRKRKWLFLVFFLGLLSLVFFTPAASVVSKSALQWVLKLKFGDPISFNSIEFKQNKIILHDPQIGKLSSRYLSNGATLQADQITISCYPNFKSKKLRCDLKIDNPVFTLFESKEAWNTLQRWFSQPSSSILSLNLQAEDGLIRLVKAKEKVEYPFYLYSSDIGDNQELIQAGVKDSDNELTLLVKKKDHKLNLKLKILKATNELFVSTLQFYQTVACKPCIDCINPKGEYHGEIDVSFSDKYTPECSIKLHAKNLSFMSANQGLNAWVPEARFYLKNARRQHLSKGFTSSKWLENILNDAGGSIEFSEGFTFQNQNLFSSAPKLVHGSIKVDFGKNIPTKALVEGRLQKESFQEPFRLFFEGSLLQRKGSLEAFFLNTKKDHPSIQVLFSPHSQNEIQLETKLDELTNYQAKFIFDSISSRWRSIKSLSLQQGILNASLKCVVSKNKVSSFVLDSLNLQNAHFIDANAQYSFRGVSFSAEGSCEQVIPFCEKDLNLRAQLQIDHLSCSLEPSVSRLACSVEVEKGYIQKIDIEGVHPKNQIKARWRKEDETHPFKAQLSLAGETLLKQLPNSYQEDYQNLNKEQFTLLLRGAKNKSGWTLQLHSFVDQKKWADLRLDFGTTRFLDWIHLNNLPQNFQLAWQKCVSVTGFREGYFKIPKLDVEKFINPISEPNQDIALKGLASFEGAFNSKELNLQTYDYDLSIDHPDLWVQLSSFDHIAHTQYSFFKEPAVTLFPFESARCYLKGSKLEFKDLKGKGKIKGNHFHVPYLSGISCGISMTSDLSLTVSSSDQLDLSLKQLTGRCPLSDLATFLNAFELDALSALPFQGNVWIKGNQSTFTLQKKEKYEYCLKVHGEFTEGTTDLPSNEIDKISTQFAFDSSTQRLDLKDLKAKLHFAKSEPLMAICRKMNLCLSEKKPAEFKIKLQDSFSDVATLQGELILDPDKLFESFDFKFYPQSSSFRKLNFKHAHFILDEKKLTYAHVDFNSSFQGIMDSFIFLSPQFMTSNAVFDVMRQINGNIQGQWSYLDSHKQHKFSLFSDQLTFQKNESAPFKILATWEDQNLTLEELDFFSYKAVMKAQHKAGEIYFKDFRLHKRGGAYLNLSGSLQKDSLSFSGKIHKLSGDVSECLSFMKNKPSCKGRLDLHGGFSGHLKPGFGGECHLSGKTDEVALSSFALANGPVDLGIQVSQNHLNISHIKAQLSHFLGHTCSAYFEGQNLTLNPILAKSSIEQIAFRYPRESLSEINAYVRDFGYEQLLNSIENLKPKGDLKGSFSYCPENKQQPLIFKLEKDEYFLLGQLREMDSIRFDSNDYSRKISFKMNVWDSPYWFEFFQDRLLENSYFCKIFENDPKNHSGKTANHLTIKSHLDQNKKFVIESLCGELAGAHFDWIYSKEEAGEFTETFKGQTRILNSSFFESLPKKIKETLSPLKLGEGLYLTGRLQFDYKTLKPVGFEGILGGHHFNLMGYSFKSLHSKVFMQPEKLTLKNIQLSDLSGQLQADEVSLGLKEGQYVFSVPKLVVSNLKPSLLKASNQGAIRPKPLNIERFELKDLKGNLLDLDSIKGHGYLKFVKSTKKTVTILDVPVHLIAKLGLDLKMLDPVEGRILYEIHNQKVHLTRFLDVYSQDRHCHFQVLKNLEGSTIDFNGNLDISIRMKQYVLLKFTEPYIISIKGNVTRPKYAFKKRKVVINVPQREDS